MIPKADFIYEVIDGIPCIIDLDLGNKSVTNDIENVLKIIINDLGCIPRLIVYRDSQGIWDGVFISDRIFFFPLGYTEQQEAVNCVNNLLKQMELPDHD